MVAHVSGGCAKDQTLLVGGHGRGRDVRHGGCVSALTNGWEVGVVTGAQKGAIMLCAAKAP
jgi:hypothetical protein